MKILISLSVSLLIFSACRAQTKGQKKKTSSPYTTCQVVKKPYINKAGKASEVEELYLRCSVQDYFIKFCESKVSPSEVEDYLNSSITIKMNIKEGSWDICTDHPEYMQSRIGTYITIDYIVREF